MPRSIILISVFSADNMFNFSQLEIKLQDKVIGYVK